jgi:hypothetical protein
MDISTSKNQKPALNDNYPIPENPVPKIFMDTDTNLKLFLKYLKNNPIDFYLPGFAQGGRM